MAKSDIITLGLSEWIREDRFERYLTTARMNYEIDRIQRQHWQANTLAYLGYNVPDVDFWPYMERLYMAGLGPRSAAFEMADIMRIYFGGRRPKW